MTVFFARPADDRSDDGRTRQQGRSFEFDHVEILLDRNRLPGFEIHIVLLAFADFDGHRIEAGENLRQHLGRVFAQQAVGADEHRIARQDGDVLSPFGEDGRVAPAHRRVVHDVAVQQREIMENLDAAAAGMAAWGWSEKIPQVSISSMGRNRFPLIVRE